MVITDTQQGILDSTSPSSVHFLKLRGMKVKSPPPTPGLLVTSVLRCSWYISIRVDEELTKRWREWAAYLIAERRLPAQLQGGGGGHEQARLLSHQEATIRRAKLGQLPLVHVCDRELTELDPATEADHTRSWFHLPGMTAQRNPSSCRDASRSTEPSSRLGHRKSSHHHRNRAVSDRRVSPAVVPIFLNQWACSAHCSAVTQERCDTLRRAVEEGQSAQQTASIRAFKEQSVTRAAHVYPPI